MTDPDPEEPAPHLDPAAWAGLIERLEIPVILVAISSWMGNQLKQDCSVEDIWQETLAMAWRDREAHEWRGLRAFRAWLLGIARNRVLDAAERMKALKRGGDRRPVAFSQLAGSDSGSISALLPHGSTTPSRSARDLERAQIIEEALAALPGELAEVVRLRLLEELPMRLVAERVGIGLTTANERFFRGAAIYRTNLERRLGGSSQGGIFER